MLYQSEIYRVKSPQYNGNKRKSMFLLAQACEVQSY